MADILIIDDSLTVRMDLKEALEDAGFSTALASSAAQARERVRRGEYRLIILDILLPDGDGLDLLREFRADARTAGIPVMLLSSHAEIADRLGETTVEEYVGKPYDRDRVVERARELLRAQGAEAAAAPAQPFQAKRILAVDDSPTYLNELAAQLQQEGFTVVTARSGEEALGLLRSQPFDCILLDLVMPGLSGQETCRHVRSEPEWRSIPVLMLTAHDDRDATVSSFNAGADDYISKLSDFAVVRARLRAHLRRKEFEDENRRIREQLHRSEIEAAQARLNREATKRARQWQTTFDAIGEGIALLDGSAGIVQANRAMERILGRDPHEIAGKALVELLPRDVAGQIRPLLGHKRSDEPRQPLEVAIRGRWYRLTLDPVGPTDAEPGGLVCILSDISERRTAEAELMKAKTAAEAANAAKDRFLAVLSHELRTPLTPVLMSVSAMAGQPDLPQEVIDDVQMIRRNVELEVRLIDDLLDLSRIIHGKLTLRREPRDVHEKLKAVLDICRPEIEEKRLVLTVDLAADDDNVHGDAGRLQQVFWNLLKNAVKFTPAGGRIAISTSNPSEGWLRVNVSDTGIGIAPERLTSLFNAFEQEGPEITRDFGGLGLGLAISKAVVEMHGGSICAESAGRGTGAVFTVQLPTIASRRRTADNPGAPETACSKAPRILLVEDHESTAIVVARLLTRRGYEVTRASDVKSAVETGRTADVDILVSDLGLPDGSGLDIMRELKQRRPGLLGIALTGYGMQEDVARSREAGFSEHLTKPVDFNLLHSAIERLASQLA